MRRSLICSIFCLLFIFSRAQSPAPSYPRGYFRWPVDLRPEIVANLGELRANHWHMGLDVRTGAHVNERVYAAADGYISYIGIRPYSFGRFIMINHPNGLTTLYGHLNTFAPAIEEWVTEQQYKSESWSQEITLDSSLFPVKKGEFISFSGTTGGSQGPHVHFEIRSTETNECLNPLLFGFPLTDKLPPILQQVALYDRSQSIYNSGVPQSYTLKLTPNGYTIPKIPVVVSKIPVIGLGLRAFDRINGSSNRDGIYSAMVWMDDEFVTGFLLDSIDYDETGYYNAHVDYRNHYHGKTEYQLLNKLPNDHSGVYRMKGDGSIRLTDSLTHHVYIEVKDSYDNLSTVSFDLRLDDNAMVSGGPGDDRFIPGTLQTLNRRDFQLQLPPAGIYDTVKISYHSTVAAANALSGTYTVNDESIPVHQQLKVRIRPAMEVSGEDRDHIILMRRGTRSKNLRKAIWEGDWLTADFGDFGTFSAYIDRTPPTIDAPGSGDTINLSRSTQIDFSPSDASGIQDLKVWIDGQWIRFTNDKSRKWIYRFDERVPYGVHDMRVSVEDLAGNITEKTWWFRRAPYTPPPPRKKTSTKSRKGKPAVKKSAGSKAKPSKK